MTLALGFIIILTDWERKKQNVNTVKKKKLADNIFCNHVAENGNKITFSFCSDAVIKV